MARIFVADHITLDGVVQGPGRPDEDTRDGFRAGGWAVPRSDATVAAALNARVREAGGMRLLLGHRSYDDMLGHWNAQGGPFRDGLNGAEKLVVSRSAHTALPWPRSTLITGDVEAQVRDLTSRPGADLCVMGSGALVQDLLAWGLIDELLLFVHPIVLGTGHRLFEGGPLGLELLSSRAADTGVIVAHYAVGRPA